MKKPLIYYFWNMKSNELDSTVACTTEEARTKMVDGSKLLIDLTIEERKALQEGVRAEYEAWKKQDIVRTWDD